MTPLQGELKELSTLLFNVYFSVLVLQVDQDEEEGLYLQQICQHQVTQERLTTIKLNHGKNNVHHTTAVSVVIPGGSLAPCASALSNFITIL